MDQRGNAEERDLSLLAPHLINPYLSSGRFTAGEDLELKPWMLRIDVNWPDPHKHLNALECHIAKLKNPHRSPEWTASRCSNGLDP